MAAAVPGIVCVFQKGLKNSVLSFPGHFPLASRSTPAHILGPNLVTRSPQVSGEPGKYSLYGVRLHAQLKTEGSVIKKERGMVPGDHRS